MKLRQIIIIENDEHLDYTGINPEIQGKLQKYKPHFQQWSLQELRKGENANSVIDAIEYYQSKIKDNRFQEILGKLTPSPKNILTLNLDQLKTAQSQYDEKYNRASKRELRKQLKQNYVEVLLDTPKWKIIKIEKTDNTDGAAKILSEYARGTKWCVTDPETGDDNYLSDGPLYVIFKDGVKWALCHIQSQQLMNISNVPIKLGVRAYNVLSPYIPGIGIFTDKKSDSYHEARKLIPSLAYYYALSVVKGRWPEAEPYIMKNPLWASWYAQHIIGDRWPEAEPYIAKRPNPAASYAEHVIKGRWPEAEPIIMKDPEQAQHYVLSVIKGRWPEAEPYIMQNPMWAYRYALSVIKGRWPEAEPYIMKNPGTAFHYARDVIKGRWPEAEPYIMQGPYAVNYEHFIHVGNRN